MFPADILIVGGGIIGCAIAYYLAKGLAKGGSASGGGARVAVIERGELGGQASGAAAGILAPPLEAAPGGPFHSAKGGPFHDLCRASLALYPALVDALREETSIDVQFLASGLLLVAEGEEQAQALRQVVHWQREAGLPLQWVEGEPLRQLEPALSAAIVGAAYSPQGHQVNSGLLTQALAQAAAARGASLQPGTAVRGLLARGDRVVAVRTSAGTIAADHIVLAAGPWTRLLARKLGVNVPTRPMRGQMLAYRSTLVRHMVWGMDGYLVPKAGGFLFAGATVEDVGFRPRTTRRGLAWLRRMSRRLVPALRYAQVASPWAALRPGSPDGLPILGPLPGWRNITVATGHFRNGILLAPITGKLMAQHILEGKTEMPLAPFSPARFA